MKEMFDLITIYIWSSRYCFPSNYIAFPDGPSR